MATKAASRRPLPAEEKPRADPTPVPSPEEFYAEMVQRPDIRKILEILAK